MKFCILMEWGMDFRIFFSIFASLNLLLSVNNCSQCFFLPDCYVGDKMKKIKMPPIGGRKKPSLKRHSVKVFSVH